MKILHRINNSMGDVILSKFIVIPSDKLEEFDDFQYDPVLEGYIVLWHYLYNRITRQSESGMYPHSDVIDSLPFALRKKFHQCGYWGRTDWYTTDKKFFVSTKLPPDKLNHLKHLCK